MQVGWIVTPGVQKILKFQIRSYVLNQRRKEIVGKVDQWRLRLFHVDLSRDVPFEANDCCHVRHIQTPSCRELLDTQPGNQTILNLCCQLVVCCVLITKHNLSEINLLSHMTELGRHHETSSLLVDGGKGGFQKACEGCFLAILIRAIASSSEIEGDESIYGIRGRIFWHFLAWFRFSEFGCVWETFLQRFLLPSSKNCFGRSPRLVNKFMQFGLESIMLQNAKHAIYITRVADSLR